MEKDVIRFNSVSIAYDEKRRDLKATVSVVFSDGHRGRKTYRGIVEIEDVLSDFAKQERVSLATLCSREDMVIIKDKDIERTGVFIGPEENNQRYVFDRSSGKFAIKRRYRNVNRETETVTNNQEQVLRISNENLARFIMVYNPTVTFDLAKKADGSVDYLYVSVPVEELILPEGFHYDGKYITNGILSLETRGKEKEQEPPVYLEDLVRIIQVFNPTVEFEVEYKPDGSIDYLKSSVPGEQLVLPDGFYFDGEFVTNRDSIKGGMYTLLAVRPLVKDQTQTYGDRTNNHSGGIREDLVNYIISSNPNVTFNVQRDENGIVDHLQCSVPGNQLVLPQGFYFDGERITNRGNTLDGNYMFIDLKPLTLNNTNGPTRQQGPQQPPVQQQGPQQRNQQPPVQQQVQPVPYAVPRTPNGNQTTNNNGNNRSNKSKIDENTRKKIVTGIKIASVGAVIILLGSIGWELYENINSNSRVNDRITRTTDDKTTTSYSNNIQLDSGGAIVTDRQGNEYIVPNNNANVPVHYDEYGNPYIKTSEMGGSVDDNVLADESEYAYLGSAVSDEDMEAQLQAITDDANDTLTHTFQYNVVSDERDTIAVINAMRNDVVTGRCSGKAFTDNIVNYVFDGNTSFNGKGVNSFQSLSPYSQFIVIRMSQGVIKNYCKYYTSSDGRYNASLIADSYRYLESGLYEVLTGKGYSK